MIELIIDIIGSLAAFVVVASAIGGAIDSIRKREDFTAGAAIVFAIVVLAGVGGLWL